MLIIGRHIIHAANNPKILDDRQALAVSARMELDLRIGAALTRFQSLNLQGRCGLPSDAMISYGSHKNSPYPRNLQTYSLINLGSCQFPTLGFVVERYLRVKGFTPEQFWYLKLVQSYGDTQIGFKWKRTRLFDRMVTVLLFESCIRNPATTIERSMKKATRK